MDSFYADSKGPESAILAAVNDHRSPRTRAGLALVVGILMAIFATRAMGAPDPRELKAREDFAGGRYQEALDLFARLYAESLHPNYLRNIGRCYQNLGQRSSVGSRTTEPTI
jgi:hypothetical protein